MLNPCFYPLLQGVTKVPESKKAHFITLNKNWVNNYWNSGLQKMGF